ncbi:hypothetical protein D3C74_385360 [compost metagenome]
MIGKQIVRHFVFYITPSKPQNRGVNPLGIKKIARVVPNSNFFLACTKPASRVDFKGGVMAD